MTSTVADAELAAARAAVVRVRHAGRRRALLVGGVLAVVALVVIAVSVSVGTYRVPLTDVVPALLGVGDPRDELVVHSLRLPRTLCALLVGAALGASGAVFQSISRNELASPDIIGITAGASTAAVLMIVVARAGSAELAIAALLGALVTAVVIYALAYRRGLSEYRLILVGIGVAALLESITAYLLTQTELIEIRRAMRWLVGDLNGTGWADVRTIAIAAAVLLPALLLLRPALEALTIGDDAAAGLGVRVERQRAGAIACACGLAAVATAVAGPITFVAFVAAPVARRLLGSGDLALASAALAGASLLLVADLIARLVSGTVDLPVGLVTAIIGAPYLVGLLVRTNRAGLGD